MWAVRWGAFSLYIGGLTYHLLNFAFLTIFSVCSMHSVWLVMLFLKSWISGIYGGVCLHDSCKTAINKLKTGRVCLFFSFFQCRTWQNQQVFCSALTTAGAPWQSLTLRHFLHPLPFLIGGLLGEYEASQLILHSPADSPKLKMLSKMVMKQRCLS